jgi:hypothetical protein
MHIVDDSYVRSQVAQYVYMRPLSCDSTHSGARYYGASAVRMPQLDSRRSSIWRLPVVNRTLSGSF